MTITFMLIKCDDGGNVQTHTRSTYAKAEAVDAPDWVSAIGSAGGEHNLSTCETCAINSMAARAMRRMREVAADADDDREYFARTYDKNNDLTNADYLAYGADEGNISEDYKRQRERYVRQAERCPAKRLPSLYNELDKLAEVAYKQALDPGLSKVQTKAALLRHFAVKHARSIVAERLAKIATDPIERARLSNNLPTINPYVSNWS